MLERLPLLQSVVPPFRSRHEQGRKDVDVASHHVSEYVLPTAALELLDVVNARIVLLPLVQSDSSQGGPMTPEQRFESWHDEQGHGNCAEIIGERIGFLAGYAQGQAGMRPWIQHNPACWDSQCHHTVSDDKCECDCGLVAALRTLPTEEAPHAEG